MLTVIQSKAGCGGLYLCTWAPLWSQSPHALWATVEGRTNLPSSAGNCSSSHMTLTASPGMTRQHPLTRWIRELILLLVYLHGTNLLKFPHMTKYRTGYEECSIWPSRPLLLLASKPTHNTACKQLCLPRSSKRNYFQEYKLYNHFLKLHMHY